jgi:hypothetical protein
MFFVGWAEFRCDYPLSGPKEIDSEGLSEGVAEKSSGFGLV